MEHREELQYLLEALLGSANVYFQPPEGSEMEYDCIRYELDAIQPEYADNIAYQLHNRYKVTFIHRDPNSDIPHKIASLPLCRHERRYPANNLYHDVFTIYW